MYCFPWREYEAAPLSAHDASGVSALRFDDLHEALWAGCESGALYCVSVPTLEPYSRWQTHPLHSPVLDVLPLQGLCLSVSAQQAAFSTCGGVTRMTLAREEAEQALCCCCWEPGQAAARALLGEAGGGVAALDLATGRATQLSEQIDPAGGGAAVLALRAPVGRGMAVAGLASGIVLMLDPRAQLKAAASVAAHTGGLQHLDAHADTVATCGYTLRMGQPLMDAFVKVFDVRFGLRPLLTLPFPALPSSLAFHPAFTSTLLVASSPSSMFAFLDVGAGVAAAANATHVPVDTAGDALTCVAMGSSGEAAALGGSGGYVHLWSDQEVPRVTPHAMPLEPHPHVAPPTVHLSEADPLSRAPQFPLSSGHRLLSDEDPLAPMAVGLPPRVVDPQLFKDLKQVDFVGYLVNPHFSRSKAPGEAARAAYALRNQRVQMKSERQDAEGLRAERAQRRAEQGGVVLPTRYLPVEIKVQASLRFEEFDFSYYNRTCFAGLENGLPNCYCNAFLQALYFNPALHDLILSHKPEPDVEFCLTCELHFLFRMMDTARGMPCQATNLLSTLRQVREASALGLLDGTGVSPVLHPEGTGAWALSKKVAALSRFLLDSMHKEVPPVPVHAARSGIAQPPPGNVELLRTLDEVAALGYRQRMVCLGGSHAERSREAHCFQVDLQYPGKPSKPSAPGAKAVAGAQPAPAAAAAASGKKRSQGAGKGEPASHEGDAEAAGAGEAAPAAGAVTGDADAPTSTFADLLKTTLEATNDTRAWFDEQLGYQMLRQSRVPLRLPKVLMINCSPTEAADVEWWTAAAEALNGFGPSAEPGDESKLPWALSIASTPSTWQVAVGQGNSAKELLEAGHGMSKEGSVCGVYELTGVVSNVHDADAEEDVRSPGAGGARAAAASAAGEGHLVACVQVAQHYWDEHQAARIAPPAFGSKGSFSSPTVPPPKSPLDAAMLLPLGKAASGEKSLLAGLGLPGLDLPDDLDDVFSSMTFGVTDTTADTPAPEEGTPPKAEEGALQSRGSASARLTVRSSSMGMAAEDPGSRPWLLANDFSLSMCPPSEVRSLYAGQKLPVLLYYTRVDGEASTSAEAGPATAATPSKPHRLSSGSRAYEAAAASAVGSSSKQPVLTSEEFGRLCMSPPLQGPQAKLPPFRFRPLDLSTEAPCPGMLLAIDAEFVALPPLEDRTFDGASDTAVKQARLCLARVSVLRGEGPHSGTPLIDDYVRSVEPVYDYLTRYSGVHPGDLDVLTSRHYLTTLKHSYLKLRYLADCGCVFVGHGLKKDFRIINLTLPPEQHIDTVELFSYQRQRKLSLRFLASYLLGIHIQNTTHDAIEDARTALRLYEKYKQLVAAGTFSEKLAEMYQWGKQYGWEAVQLGKDGRPIVVATAATHML